MSATRMAASPRASPRAAASSGHTRAASHPSPLPPQPLHQHVAPFAPPSPTPFPQFSAGALGIDVNSASLAASPLRPASPSLSALMRSGGGFSASSSANGGSGGGAGGSVMSSSVSTSTSSSSWVFERSTTSVELDRAKRREIIARAVRAAQEDEAAAAGGGAGTAPARSSPVLDSLSSPPSRLAAPVVGGSGASPSPSSSDEPRRAEEARLLRAQHEQLHASLARKDEQLLRAEEQLADLTRLLEASARQRAQLDSMAREAAEREEAATIAADQARAMLETERSRQVELERTLATEQAAHAQTKEALRHMLDEQEARWRQARAELEARERAHATEIASERERREEAQASLEQALKEKREDATRMANMAGELQRARDERAAMEQQLAAHIEREQQQARAQAEAEADAQSARTSLRVAQERTEAQNVLVARLQQELATLRGDLEAAQQQLSSLPALQSELAALRTEAEKLRAQRAECDAHMAALQAKETHIGSLESHNEQLAARISEADSRMRELQAQHARDVQSLAELQDVRGHLAHAQIECDSLRAAEKRAQIANQTLAQQLESAQEQCAALRLERDSQTRSEQAMRDALESRNKALRMLLQQMQQMSDRSALQQRLAKQHAESGGSAPAAPAELPPAATASTPPIAASSTSLHEFLTASEHTFVNLRSDLFSLAHALAQRDRRAADLLADIEREASSLRAELARTREALREAEDATLDLTKSAQERYSALEATLWQTQQELLLARSESDASAERDQTHHKQLASMWRALQLYHRAYAPLLARWSDVATQKANLQEMLTEQQRATADLRELVGHLSEANDEADVSLSRADANGGDMSSHPFHPLPRRTSFRAAAIAVLAARRLWTGTLLDGSSNGSYGTPIISQGACIFLSSDRSAAAAHSDAAQNGEQEQRERERERDWSSLAALPLSELRTGDAAAAAFLRLFDFMQTRAEGRAGNSSRDRHLAPSSLTGWDMRRNSDRSLMQRLGAGLRTFQSDRRRRAALSGSHSTPPSPPASLHSAVDSVRLLSTRLVSRVRELNSVYSELEASSARAAEQSNATQETLLAEQSDAHRMLRQLMDESKRSEEQLRAELALLRGQLDAAQSAQSQSVPASSHAELYETSQAVLQQCRALEADNRALATEVQAARERAVYEAQRVAEQMEEKQVEMQGLKRQLDEARLSLANLDRSSALDLQQSQAEAQQLKQLLLGKDMELQQSRHQLQSLNVAFSQLELDRLNLQSAHEEAAREVQRLQSVLHGISAAHQLAREHEQIMAHSIGSSSRSSVQEQRVSRLEPSLSSSSSSSSRAAALAMPAPIAGALSLPSAAPPSLSTPLSPSALLSSSPRQPPPLASHTPSTSGSHAHAPPASAVRVRHHVDGRLSVDFGAHVQQPGAAHSQRRSTAASVLHTPAAGLLNTPATRSRSSAATSSASSSHRSSAVAARERGVTFADGVKL